MIKRLGLPFTSAMILVVAACLTSWAQSSGETFTSAVNSYFDAVDAYHSGKSEEAIRGLRHALKVFQRDQSEKGEFMVYLSLAEIYENDGKYDRAMAELEKALDLKRRGRDILGVSVTRLRMGKLETDRSRFVEARGYLEEALAGAKAMEEAHLAAIIGTNLAQVMIVNGELKQAQELLDAALPVHIKNEDDYHRALALMRLADIEIIRNQYAKATELLSQAEKFTSHEKFDALHHEILRRMAEVLKNQGRLEEARNKMEKSHEFFEKVGQRHETATAKTEMASVMMKEGRLQEALNTVQDASEDLRRLQADYEGAKNLVLQGRLLTKTGRLTEAMKSIEKGLSFFTEKNSPMGELSARIALAELQVEQGRESAALLNADRATELAIRLQTPQGKADAMYVQGLIRAASGDHQTAISEFGKALQLYQTLRNGTAEARCRICRAESFVAAGFLEAAQQDIDALRELPPAKDDLFVRGHIFMLKAAIAYARGNNSGAVVELDKAQAILGKLSSPLVEATLLERKARPAISNRNYSAALSLLEQAEKIFVHSESPTRIIQCRAAQISMNLDRNNVRDAQSIARRSLKIPWQRGYGSQNKDTDAQVLDARLSCLRARVKLASGDTGSAEKDVAKAQELALELRNKKLTDETAALLARIYAAQNKYDKTLDQCRKLSNPDQWRAGHAQAMSLVAQGKIDEALPIFSKTIGGLTAVEMGEGLRNVPSHLLREREVLYQDYIDSLATAGRKLQSPRHLNTAWEIGERLKMRHLLYLRSAVGTESFPGVPQSVIERLNTLQAEAVNQGKRQAFPVLNKEMGDQGTTSEGVKGQQPHAQVEEFITETGQKYPRFAALMKGTAPASTAVADTLSSGERYISILATGKHYHLFLVGKDGIKMSTASPGVDEIGKQADAVSRGISSPYYYKIDKRAAELWASLFGAFATEINSGESLIIETDARLTMFPFEALIPGEFPDSYQEQQTVPILLEKSAMQRTTSAFRFLGSRETAKSAQASKLIVFTRPSIPKDSSNGSSDGALLVSTWKRVLAGFGSPNGSEDAGAFDTNAQVFAEARATRANFLASEAANFPTIHLGCPVVLPHTPAGRLFQPFIVFSQENNDPATAFCGISDLSSAMLPARGAVLTWIGRTGDSIDDGLFLLVESLGLAGTGWIMLPMWDADRQGEADTTAFLTTFYGALKTGDTHAAALTKARQTIKPDSSRKNRCNSARMALF